MHELERFSVYNNLLSGSNRRDHPLWDLLPDDYDHGWHVARNLLKPLNHLDFLERQEAIAAELNLHNLLTPPATFDANYLLLKRHQAGVVPTARAMEYLSGQLCQQGRQLSPDDVAARLREYATVRHMEFHPSDVCNLSCCGCTYAHDDPARKPPPTNFPLQVICRISQMKPKSMVIIGGGEPTLYRSEGYRFQDMVDEVRRTNPGIALALVTNGTYKPPGNWPDSLRWIRLSLDAATPETYTAFRGKPMFDRVIQNYLSYLDHDVPHVGISFLFARSNIHEYAALAEMIFGLVKREKPRALPKVNIQYRPLRSDPRANAEPRTYAVTGDQITSAVRHVLELGSRSQELKAFLRNQTNIAAVLGGNTHPPHEFSRCYYSQTFRIVRASGVLRPCFIRVSEPDFVLGNIQTDSLETIALNTLCVAARRKPLCDPHGCRQCHVNYVFEQGLQGTLLPSDALEVISDPMY